jgi:uncharacterized membrane protein
LSVSAPPAAALGLGTKHKVAITATAILSAANMVALVLLVHRLLHGDVGGMRLLQEAGEIWVGNVIAFALWYWELDGGGPPRRASGEGAPDFAFAQMTLPQLGETEWRPGFVDYLYLSFTNASSFSAADTLPLTRRVKLVMLVQSAISIVTLILVAARAVNML